MGRRKPTIDDTEYSFPDEADQNPLAPEEEMATATATATKKENKKGGTKVKGIGRPFAEVSNNMDFGKKKNPKKKEVNGEGHFSPNKADMNPLAPDVKMAIMTHKENKKGGAKVEEEEDLDKILAELGEGPPSPAAAERPDCVEPEPVGAEEKEWEVADTAASTAAKKKKKKKKKEKDKEKKAAAKQEEEEETDAHVKEGKAVNNNKKPSKHVREMQEALARRKEEEERRKREEEERLRQEEEERKRLEELEKQAEEAKRRKKEREKEKRLKKKQDGKPLTAKQKEEQRTLEARRRQYLGQNQVPVADPAAVVVKKKLKYETKKSKSKPKVIGHEAAELEAADKAEEEEDVMPEETQCQGGEAEDDKEVQEEEDDNEWDAKSWDDVDVSLSAISPFAEEDMEEDDTQPVRKNDAPPPTNAEEHEEINTLLDVTSHKSSSSSAELRSPICCILGHVDAGKTKLLDYIRQTNIQGGEAGGITQQIGATYFPTENIREITKELKADAKLNVPGLLVIDTPGHESFANLRSRGSSLCDIAVLVVDIMHGLQPQTIESINLLKSRNMEFIVALNKVDRLYQWKSFPKEPIFKAMKQQSDHVKDEFRKRLTKIETQFKEQGLNTALYYENKEMGETYNIVPTSAISGAGIPDLLLLLIQRAQKTMEKKLTYVDEVECTVLEVKVIEGVGTTIDVVLVNGVLHKRDRIAVCGLQEPIVTKIKALMTPNPMKELRIKGTYQHHKKIKAAQGVKISAPNLEHAVAGTALRVIGYNVNEEDVKAEVMKDMNRVRSWIDKNGEGVYVQASTLGSLEALAEYLKSPAVNIPFSGFSIGPVHKMDVMKAGVMLARNKKEYATILAFDVKIMPEARELANETGVRIFEADIIYHLFDQFKAYIDILRAEKKRESAEDAVFPCVLKILRRSVFNKKDPIVLGVDVCEGILKVGTPICVPSRDFINIGKIASMEYNHKQVETAIKGQKVAIKIVGSTPEEQQKMFGRHFEIDDELVSRITRGSIDVLKEDHRGDLSKDDWNLVVKLKQIFGIQ